MEVHQTLPSGESLATLAVYSRAVGNLIVGSGQKMYHVDLSK